DHARQLVTAEAKRALAEGTEHDVVDSGVDRGGELSPGRDRASLPASDDEDAADSGRPQAVIGGAGEIGHADGARPGHGTDASALEPEQAAIVGRDIQAAVAMAEARDRKVGGIGDNLIICEVE